MVKHRLFAGYMLFLSLPLSHTRAHTHTHAHKAKPMAAMQNIAIVAQWTSTGIPVHHSGIPALFRQILLVPHWSELNKKFYQIWWKITQMSVQWPWNHQPWFFLFIAKYSSFTTVSSWAQVEVLTQTQQIICCTYASQCCYTCSIELSKRLQFDTQVNSCITKLLLVYVYMYA